MKFPAAYRNAISQALATGDIYSVGRTLQGYSVIKGAISEPVYVAQPYDLPRDIVMMIEAAKVPQVSRLSQLFSWKS